MPKNDIGGGVADEDAADPGGLHEPGGGVIIAGEKRCLPPRRPGGAEIGEGEFAGGGIGHLGNHIRWERKSRVERREWGRTFVC